MRISGVLGLVTGAVLLLAGACSSDDNKGTMAGTGGMLAAGTGAGGMLAAGATAAGTAAAGVGAAGTAAAGVGAAGTAAAGGTATATIMPFGTGISMGTATFTQSGTDVTVTVTLTGCTDGPHPNHIHMGTSCADADMQGGHWNMAQGEGIPDIMCVGGTGSVTYMRTAANPTLAWSVGGAPATNVVGHAFVVHDMGDPAPRTGCGIIAM